MLIKETIDQSIKNIIQLKTMDNSLEWAQTYDALKNTPEEFQSKLIDTLNSLGQTLNIPSVQVFNKIFCKSDDDENNPDVKKKLYNFWKAFFEILAKADVPNDKKQEFWKAIDEMLAQAMKDNSSQADKGEDNTEMVSEKDNSIRFGKGDVVDWEDPETGEMHYDWEVGGVLGDEFKLYPSDGSIKKARYVSEFFIVPKKDKKMLNEEYQEADIEDENKMNSDFDFAVQELGEVANKVKNIVNFVNPYCECCKCNTSNEVKHIMKNKKDESVGSNNDWVSMDELVGMEVSEGDDGEASWKEIDALPPTKKVMVYLDKLDKTIEIDVPADIADSESSTALYEYVDKWIDEQKLGDSDFQIMDIESKESSSTDGKDDSDEIKDKEKKYKQDDGETKTLITGCSKKEKTRVNEMTIEQEIDDPWKLMELMWGQGQDNMRELLEADVVDEETLMSILDDSGVKDLTSINDWFAYDFSNILEMLDCDVDAWNDRLEITKKSYDNDEDDEEEEA